MHRFNAALLSRVQALPGVEHAAIAASHPLDAGSTNSFVIVGREEQSRDLPELSMRQVTPSYFATLRIPIVNGRVLMRNRKVLTLDEAAVIREANTHADTVRATVGK